MEVSDILDKNEFAVLNLIVKVLSAKTIPNVLLFLYKDQSGNYAFSGMLPDGRVIDAEFTQKFAELAKEYLTSMQTPGDNFNVRINNILTRWRKAYKQGTIEKLDNGNVNIKFN